MLTVGSGILAAAILLGTALISHGHRIGWLYMVGVQVPATFFDLATRQYGFIAMSFVGGWLYWRGWRRRAPSA